MIDLSSIAHIGRDLDRPECVIATSDGSFYVSHRGRGATRIAPDGTQTILADVTVHNGLSIIPNGIALRPDGTLLLANISDAGGILELDPDGCRPVMAEIEGRQAPPVNFVTLDDMGRLWFSVSSRKSPRHLAYRRDVADGFIGVVDKGQVRIVADGLAYTNEIRPDLDNGWLYVSETFGFRISRFPISRDLTLGPRETFATMPKGAFVDGIALDAEGGLIAVCIVSNEVFRCTPDGELLPLLSERVVEWTEDVETALDKGQMGRHHFDEAPTRTLRNVASAAFHSKDLRRVVLGSLLGSHLIDFPAPVAGREPVHWHVAPLDW